MLGACAQQSNIGASDHERSGFERWKSTLLLGHPLAGRIWVPKDRRFMAPEELLERMRQAKYILLGERHDNPDHHRIQAWVTARLIKSGRRPALVMEMFRTNQQAKIDAHLAAHPGDSDGLGKAAGWARSGWPPWRQYQPIVRPIVAHGLPLMAANLSRSRIRAIFKNGFKALKPPERRALRLDRPFPQKNLGARDQEIADAHCGFLKRSGARPFTRVQIIRDALFAQAMRKGAAKANGAVLITGAGHARNDRGVPFHLMRAAIGQGDIFSLGIVEVAEDAPRPDQYGAVYGARRLPFDAVWFTPRTARPDPCDKFKKFRKKK